jgi:hypothetical protein
MLNEFYISFFHIFIVMAECEFSHFHKHVWNLFFFSIETVTEMKKFHRDKQIQKLDRITPQKWCLRSQSKDHLFFHQKLTIKLC